MKKRSFILTAFLLILAIALPFCFNGAKVLAEGTDTPVEIKGYHGFVSSTEVKDVFKEVNVSDLVVTAGTDKEVYKDGKYVEGNEYFYSLKLTKNSGDLVVKYAANFDKANPISLKIANKDGTIVKNFNITKIDYANISEIQKEFKYDFTDAALQEYKNNISGSLKSGDTFNVPSFEEIIKTASLNYSDIQKTVYYAYSGSGYTSTTGNSFTLSGVGEYRYYAEFKSDSFDSSNAEDKTLKISAKGLVEKIDGFYRATAQIGGEEKNVYAERDNSTGDYKYYELDDKGEKNEDKIVEESQVTIGTDCIIPIFAFNVAPIEKPTITVGSSYQENGFIGQEYSVSSITVKNAETTKYTLVYSATADGEYTEASEELVDNSKFTPSKTGYYKIRVYAMSENGGEETKDTAVIEVKKAFETVKYKVGFKDWLSVNKLPFVFLCISAACLVGIVLLLFINPKPKDKKVEEEDK